MNSQLNDPYKPISVNVVSQANTAPVKAGWILIIITALCYVIPLPIGWIGWVLNFVGFIISIVIIANGATTQGIIQLLVNLLVLPCLYVVALLLIFGGFALFAASQNGAGMPIH